MYEIHRRACVFTWTSHRRYHITDKPKISKYIGLDLRTISGYNCERKKEKGAMSRDVIVTNGILSDGVKMKPPNIAVYADKDQFVHLKTVLHKCVNIYCYTFIHLNDKKVKCDPWRANVELLVVAKENVPVAINKIFYEYWQKGGKLLDICSDFVPTLFPGALERQGPWSPDNGRIGAIDTLTSSRISLEVPIAPFLIRENAFQNLTSIALRDTSDTVLVGLLTSDDVPKGTLVFSQARPNVEELDFWRRLLSTHLGLNCEENPETCVTPCYLYANNKRRLQQFLDCMESHTKDGHTLKSSAQFSLDLVEAGENIPPVTPTHIPLVISKEHGKASALGSYFRHLETEVLGKVVIFGDVLPSTMDLLDSHTMPHGVTVIASRQTRGKGRSENCWLSPEGCAMFSVLLRIPIHSKLGQKLPFIQHLAAMAMVDGIRTLPGCQKLDLRLKWPNDIYYGDKVKLGGLIVQSSLIGDTVHCVIGCGLNISNGSPTMCVNDVIEKDCPSVPPLTPQVSIARTLTVLEELVHTFQYQGSEAVLPRYYQLWLHQNAEVTCTQRGQVQAAVVQGLDSYGFLNVYLKGDRRTFSVQPDGNSFDMIHNLIIFRDSA